jgi:hypothetical protein
LAYQIQSKHLCNRVHRLGRNLHALADQALQTIADYLADPATVFARSHGHCCICGRSLTDELSRSRGIGPECIKITPYMLFRTERSIVEPELASA